MKKNIDIKIYFYKSFFKKFKGVMFKKKQIDYGVLFDKTNSIHTFFCFQNIDVIMLDRNYKIKYVYNNISPNKIILPKKEIYYTLELPKDFIIYNSLKKGDVLSLTNLSK